MKVPSSKQHFFSSVPKAEIPRSKFDRSFTHKSTFNVDYLNICYMDEALPADTFTLKMTAFARLATPIKPIMDNIYADVFFFAVPLRLLWDNFLKFNGEQTNPGDSTDYVVPTVTAPAGGYLHNSLEDYMGLPTLIQGITHSALFHRAYNLIYNTWFRDQNLIDSVYSPTDDGPDTIANYTLLKRGKRHDYFTSCLPWPQKGPNVELPLGDSASVIFPTNATLRGNALYDAATAGSLDGTMQSDGSGNLQSSSGTGPVAPIWLQSTGALPTDAYADLTNATASTINALRQAFQLQRLYERDARGGSRYTEIIRAHFGVISPDARMQRPEYLGGGTAPVNISPIAQTSASDGTLSPQANLSGVGTVRLQNVGFTKSFTEHCIIIGLINFRADLNYQQGLHRMFTRSTRFDFYWPALSHIGEQAVLNKEIYCQGPAGGTDDDDVFGYQERFAEYRYKPGQITGTFRSDHPQSLDLWHLAQDYASLPVLDETFITEAVPLDRCIAVQDEPHFLFDSYFDLKCARPMPVYGVPGMIDHF